MPTAGRIKLDIQQEIITQLALLNEQFASLKTAVEESNMRAQRGMDDHENRIRELEKMNTRIDVINQKIGTFNLAQASFTTIAAILAYWFKRA